MRCQRFNFRIIPVAISRREIVSFTLCECGGGGATAARTRDGYDFFLSFGLFFFVFSLCVQWTALFVCDVRLRVKRLSTALPLPRALLFFIYFLR